MRRPFRDLFTVGRWTLAVWIPWRMWTLRPRHKTYWKGELHHYSWLMFELIHDDRKDWIADVFGLESHDAR